MAVLIASSSTAARVEQSRYTWSNVVIRAGGLLPGLAFHPTEPDLLYARTDVGGVYRFDSEGRQWIPLNDDIPRSHWQWNGVVSLAFDSTQSDHIYAAAGSYPQAWGEPGALLSSANRGQSWEAFPLPFKLPGNADGRNTGQRLLVHPGHESTLWLGSADHGLWRSSDCGRTWQPRRDLPQTMVTAVFASDLRQDAGHPTLYAAFQPDSASSPALWYSVDDGLRWAPLPGQPTGLIVQHTAWDADGRLYLTFSDKLGPNGIQSGALWRFDPRERSWVNLTPSLTSGADRAEHGFGGIATDPTAPGTVIVSSLNRWHDGNQIWRSTDAGLSWISCFDGATWDHRKVAYAQSLQPHWITDLAINPHDSKQVWFVTGYGLWFTADVSPNDGSAPHWQFMNDGLEETVVEELISPPIGAPLLSALGDIGGFRHIDLSASPAAGAFAPGHGSSSTIAYAGLVPTEMVRTHAGKIRAARSHDGGVTWQPLRSAPLAAIAQGPGSLVISADASRLLWLPKGGEVHISTDDGASWTPIALGYQAPSNHRTARLVADQVNPLWFTLYAPEDGRFWTSVDGGVSWNVTQILAPDGGIPRAEPRQAGVVWVPTDNGLWVSSNQGRSFTKLPAVDAAYQIGFGHAAPGATRDSLFMQGRVNGCEGLFRTDDSGNTWVKIDDPEHRYGWLRVVMGDGQVHGRVYLGTSGRGIIMGHPTAD